MLPRIRQIVVEAENAWRIELADRSFKMVWIMTCLSISRKCPADERTFISAEENIQHYNEYSFAESIYQRIEKEYQIKIAETDIRFLAVLLLSAKKLKKIFGIFRKKIMPNSMIRIWKSS